MTGLRVAVLALGIVSVAALVAVWVLTIALRRARRTAAGLQAHLDAVTGGGTRSPGALAMQALRQAAVRIRSRGVVGGLVMASFEDLAQWVSEDRAAVAGAAAPDGMVTVLFTDIEQSTALNEQLGDAGWLRLLEVHDDVVRRAVARRHGHIVKGQGDGFMVVFADAADAAQAAIDVQRGLDERPRSRRRQPHVAVRIGLHVGQVISKDGDFFGLAVAMAARIAAAASGRQILASSAIRLRIEPTSHFQLTPIGEVPLRGLEGLHELWELHWQTRARSARG